MTDRLYFRQILAGDEIASDDPLARQMVNFVYLIGDRETGEAVVVDPAYDISTLVDLAAADDMTIVGALATHYHPDHVGGDMMGHSIQGVADLLEIVDVPIHVNEAEVPWVQRVTGVDGSHISAHAGGDTVTVGAIGIELVHTPGHTPGSQCFLVDGRLVSGDTLFLNGCGRTDLPGGDPDEMFRSLHERLARVPDSTILFPGHLYSPEPSQAMGDVRTGNYVFRLTTPRQWVQMFGGN